MRLIAGLLVLVAFATRADDAHTWTLTAVFQDATTARILGEQRYVRKDGTIPAVFTDPHACVRAAVEEPPQVTIHNIATMLLCRRDDALAAPGLDT